MMGNTTRPAWVVVGLLLLASASGCVQRELLWPTYMEPQQQEHIYFVEQEAQTSSRIKKCDVAQDNTVKCAVQYDLE